MRNKRERERERSRERERERAGRKQTDHLKAGVAAARDALDRFTVARGKCEVFSFLSEKE